MVSGKTTTDRAKPREMTKLLIMAVLSTGKHWSVCPLPLKLPMSVWAVMPTPCTVNWLSRAICNSSPFSARDMVPKVALRLVKME